MKNVNIIGGGIAGLTLANALMQKGIDFQLYERAPRITEIGAAISMSKAAQDILDKLGLLDQVRNAGHLTHNSLVTDENLKIIQFSRLASPVVIIHRAKLVDILSSRLPEANIHLNARLSGIRILDHHADLDFYDGTQIRSECTAIADGIHSVARTQIFPGIKIRYARQAIWRGITSISVPEQFLHSYFELWANAKRFLIAIMDPGKIFWLAVVNTPPGGKDDPDTVREKLLEDFNEFHPFVKELIANSSNFIRSDMADLGTQKRKWYNGSAVFLGDSIHATTPNLGQGGCQAIEDAYCLSCMMKEYNFDNSRVFPAYQALREKKVSYIVNTSWNIGKLAHNSILSKLALTYFKYLPERVVVKLENKLNDISYLSDSKA